MKINTKKAIKIDNKAEKHHIYLVKNRRTFLKTRKFRKNVNFLKSDQKMTYIYIFKTIYRPRHISLNPRGLGRGQTMPRHSSSFDKLLENGIRLSFNTLDFYMFQFNIQLYPGIPIKYSASKLAIKKCQCNNNDQI